MRRIIFLACLLCIIAACSSGNLNYVRDRAPEIWKRHGFEIVAYEGYKWGQGGVFGCSYGGAEVWFRLKKIPDNGITYSGYLVRWGNEIHVYGPIAIDAIQPNNWGN